MTTPAGPPLPLILDDVSLKIGTGPDAASLVELRCVSTHIELSPDTAITTVDTFCGSTDYPGITKWSLVATLVQSFDPDATEETLSAAVASGGPVPFLITPRTSQPVGPTNPSWGGMLVPRPYAPINGDAGDASTIDLEWSLVGEPVKSVTPGATQAQATKAAA